MNLLKPFLFTFFFLGFANLAFAQPSNDDCNAPINIPNVLNWCSNVNQYTNVGATDSGYGPATCFGNAGNDVWFSFTPVATDVTLTIQAGSLNNSEVALYFGTCGGTINELGCATSFGGIAELYRGGLQVGVQYLIRVQGAGNSTGNFQLCINNYNPPVDPGSDCISGSVLCDKSQFTVQEVTGAGNDPDEAENTCLDIFGNSESSSTWFKWVAETNGSLTFTITPNNANDDLDFVLFELPGGLNDCNNKNAIRCMATACQGPTGLNLTSTDFEEDANCDPGEDGFVAAVNMIAGTAYALVINNFTSTGNGFSLEFGGTGDFQGPEADFDVSPPIVCQGETVNIVDNSGFPGGVGNITGWSWNFGAGANIQTANTEGPHNITYSTPGTKSIVLTVTTNAGCQITAIKEVQINEPIGVQLDGIVDNNCPSDLNGQVNITITGGNAPLTFNWSNGSTNEDLTGVATDDYTLTISDADNICSFTETYTISSTNPPFLLDYSTRIASCNGGADGGIFLNIGGAVPPFMYDWNDGAGFVSSDSLVNLTIGTYDVTIQDANGCEEELSIEVKELELIIDSINSTITPPFCFGDNNGLINITPLNGTGPYDYSYNDGLGFFPGLDSLINLPDTTIIVTIRDANFCLGTDTLVLEEPDSISIAFDSTNITCFQAFDGAINVSNTGGTPPYSFTWNLGQPNASDLNNLGPGLYQLTVTDANGCSSTDSVNIIEPPELAIDSFNIIDVICFGAGTGQIEVFVSGGRPGYTYSSDGTNFQSSNLLTGLTAGFYFVIVKDSADCEISFQAFVNEPPQLIVETGLDEEIFLGDQVFLSATASEVVSFTWTPAATLSCDTCQNPIAIPIESTTYIVIGTNADSCTASDSIYIDVDPVRPVFIPNTFTPNEDGTNDFLVVFSNGAVAQISTLQIFNRWGGLVFERTNFQPNDESMGWDGRFRGEPVNAGVFTYVSIIEFIDGHVETYSGTITVIR